MQLCMWPTMMVSTVIIMAQSHATGMIFIQCVINVICLKLLLINCDVLPFFSISSLQRLYSGEHKQILTIHFMYF